MQDLELGDQFADVYARQIRFYEPIKKLQLSSEISTYLYPLCSRGRFRGKGWKLSSMC